MRFRQLGASSLQVPCISIGCWSYGGGAQDYWGEQNQSDVNTLVSTALDLGVNYFDTAYSYNVGKSELSLGEALAGKRQQAIICDKTPVQPNAQVFEEKLVEALKRLKTDYLDILMIHWPVADKELLAKNLLALDSMRKKGYIRYAGVSNFGVGTMELARELGVEIVANEFAYSLLSRGPELEVAPYCEEHGIGITSYMSLMQGILTGKYYSIKAIPPRRRRTVQFDGLQNPMVGHAHATPPAESEVLNVLAALKRLAPECGLSMGQLALAWCLDKPAMATAIVGCRDTAQLLENMKAADKPLDAAIVAELDAASQGVLNKMGNTLDIFGGDRIW